MPTVVSTATQAAANRTPLTNALDVVARTERGRQRAQAECDSEQPEHETGGEHQVVGERSQRAVGLRRIAQGGRRGAGIRAGRDRLDVAQRRAAPQWIGCSRWIECLERPALDDSVGDRSADAKIRSIGDEDGEGDEGAMIAGTRVQRLRARSRSRARASEQVPDQDQEGEAGKIDEAHRSRTPARDGVKNACGGQVGGRAGAAAGIDGLSW